MQIEDRAEGKGKESGKIIYNTEVYIMKIDGFGKNMGLKEEKVEEGRR
jgi:hypothetical protein